MANGVGEESNIIELGVSSANAENLLLIRHFREG